MCWASTDAGKTPLNDHFWSYGCNAKKREIGTPAFTVSGPIGQTDNLALYETSNQPWRTFMMDGPDLGESARNTAMFANDPASKFMDNPVCRDARLISACMRLTNAGKLSDVAGQIGFINNIPTAALAGLQYGNFHEQRDWINERESNPAPSVNQLFQVITETERLSIQTKEVVHKPTEISVMETYKTPVDGSLLKARVIWKDGTDTDFPEAGWYNSSVVNGTSENRANQVTTGGAQETLFPGSVFGFVWRNITPDTPLIFDLVKTFEWRADPQMGFAAVIPKQFGKSKVEQAQTILDRMAQFGKSWANRTLNGENSLGEVLATISKTAQATHAQKFLVGQALRMGSNFMQGQVGHPMYGRRRLGG
jgi:hypothetical protein